MVQASLKVVPMENFSDIDVLKTGVIIYPTDTVYGIGCNAENEKLIERIFAIKERDRKKPMSVIAPGKEWILKNCIVSKEILDKYLPGKYTLLLIKKDPEFLAAATAGSNTLGVRIPAHPFSRLVRKAGISFITTSANLSGQKPAKSISEIPEKVLDAVDLIIDGGRLEGIPSAIVDCRSGEGVVVKRA